jgi:DNA (cytosine-5)-methyltransferase 1
VFRFVDLFAGIGGIRRGLEAAGGQCVFTVEADRFAMRTYSANFVDSAAEGGHQPRDMYEVRAEDVPPYDLLAAGFPCQPFSLAGVSKKSSLGRPHGFEDRKSGNLFFEILRLIDEAPAPPSILFLENVKHLTRHDGGNTFRVIRESILARDYTLAHRVVDARAWVPQHRERTFMVALHKKAFGGLKYEFPDSPADAPWPTLAAILEPGPVEDRYVLSAKLWDYLQDYALKHRAAGNGFGYGLVAGDDVARTLSARYHKDGSEILVRTDGPTPRRLTPRECARLMGYPDDFLIPVSDTQAYRQFGNSVVVPVIAHLATALVRQLARARVAEARAALASRSTRAVPVEAEPIGVAVAGDLGTFIRR